MPRHIAIISTLPTDEYRLPGFPTDMAQIEAGLRVHAAGWTYTHLTIENGRLPPLPDDVDGVVFSGSPASVNEDAPWIADILDLIRDLHASKVPMLGICFGHQAIARALGGKVAPRAGGWSLGRVHVRWGQEDLGLYAIHTEEVTDLPQGAKVVAVAPSCGIAGFCIDDHVMTTQHHPEMPKAYVSAVLDKLESDGDAGPDAKTLQSARDSLEHRANNANFMAKAARFFATAPVPQRTQAPSLKG